MNIKKKKSIITISFLQFLEKLKMHIHIFYYDLLIFEILNINQLEALRLTN